MVAGGIPAPLPDHAQKIADLALAFQHALKLWNGQYDLSLRVGIDTGPVVAGVIGRSKFGYDLWGDTVNTASRMESHAPPGAIQVTERTYNRLADRYEFEKRGSVEIKGKGAMTTYLLLRPHAPPHKRGSQHPCYGDAARQPLTAAALEPRGYGVTSI
jgi:adenylate cyclase